MRKPLSLLAVIAVVSFVGCKDQRYTTTPPANPPAAVPVDTPPHDAKVEVDTGPGGVKVDVDAPAVRERVQERVEERRESREAATPTP